MSAAFARRPAKGFPLGYLAVYELACYATRRMMEYRTHQQPWLWSSGLIPLTCNEIQHLFTALAAQPIGDIANRLRWSVWHHGHQAHARASRLPTTSHPTTMNITINRLECQHC
jgi:hypothetical protein